MVKSKFKALPIGTLTSPPKEKLEFWLGSIKSFCEEALR
jgi:hypothetical protein